MLKQQFEVHLTAAIRHIEEFNQFKILCSFLHAKPLEIILARGEYSRQIMLSKVVDSESLDCVLAQVDVWIALFKRWNIQIIRTKIEVPFPDQLTDKLRICYYEWHGLIEFKQNEITEITQLCECHDIHLSYNALKPFENFRFITLREHTTAQKFTDRLELLKKELEYLDRKTIKERFECCIYDTNIQLDRGWLESLF